MLIEASTAWNTVQYIVIDDGSSDKTAEIAQSFKKEIDLTIIRHDIPMGRGFSINEGYRYSSGEYLIVFNGKKDTTATEIKKIFSHFGSADLIISYQANTAERPIIRKLLSKTFTSLINILFARNIKYYNGSVLIKKEHFNNVNIKTSSYAYDCELLLKLLNLKLSYVEVPVYDLYEKGRKTRSVSFKNITGVIYTVFRLFIELRIMRLV